MTEWLQQRMQEHTLPQLLKLVDQINRRVLPSSGNPTHIFPVLPGSHLTEVRSCPACLVTAGTVKLLNHSTDIICNQLSLRVRTLTGLVVGPP